MSWSDGRRSSTVTFGAEVSPQEAARGEGGGEVTRPGEQQVRERTTAGRSMRPPVNGVGFFFFSFLP